MTEHELDTSIATNPVVINPNEQQFQALRDILDWFIAPPNAGLGYVLCGYAGTGKTSLIELLVRSLHSAGVSNIALTAPTNKAVKNLRSLGTHVDCCTIYSMLGLKMDQVEDELRLRKAERDLCGRYRLIVLDEAGMVNSELLEYLENAMLRYSLKVLFVGDPKQLNPIGEKKSPIWGRYAQSMLTKVERHDNQILKLATHVRSTRIRDLQIAADNDGQEGVWYESASNFEKILKAYAASGQFDGRARAVAWRNQTVSNLNRIVRQQIFGEAANSSRWLVGDRVVFTSPHDVDGINIITDEEAIVKGVVVGNHVDYALQCYYLTLSLETRRTVTVKVVHEDSEYELDNLLATYANHARRPGGSPYWKQYWGLRTSLASLKHSYALTAHRAQGSTFDIAFVDMEDICANSNRMEARRCLYVACTRARRQLILR